ncbi:MAG TPA: 4-(cytidine 5'-diphospho)-2-C-methyl-D-erythritol kinase [Methylophilaceae bacterium]|nr:4-(cytidine 5'-diphospho)-2-C-methyl-D-erythritol kinase [Methylophilaceae bacterium]
MDGFQAFPAPAKVNLFLHITGRRADGYHLLQSVFRLLDRYDTIHLKPNRTGLIGRVKDVPGVLEAHDLCIRAARLLQQHTGTRQGVEIAVDKQIPMGGGLGGGSSDAATVLLALNRLWDLNLPRQALMDLGLKLGADVPVFIFGRNAWAEGVGELLQAVSLDPAWYLVLTPDAHVSTAEIFASKELTRDTIPTTIAAFSGVTSGKEQEGLFHNDLEPVVCQRYPAVASSLEFLKKFGQARMSGSGASVFVAFDQQAEAESRYAELPKQCVGFLAKGLEQHPLYDFAD